MAGFLSNGVQPGLQGRHLDMPTSCTFNPKTKTATSVKQRAPHVSQLISGNHAEILARGNASANNASGGDQKESASTILRAVFLLSLLPFYWSPGRVRGVTVPGNFIPPPPPAHTPLTHLFGFKTYMFSSYSSQFPQRDSGIGGTSQFTYGFTCSTLHTETASGALLWVSVMKPLLYLGAWLKPPINNSCSVSLGQWGFCPANTKGWVSQKEHVITGKDVRKSELAGQRWK